MFGPFSGQPWIITDGANQPYWASQALQAGTVITVDANDTISVSKSQLVFDRTTPVGTREDVMVAGLWWCAPAGSNSAFLSSADKTALDTAIAAWWTTMKAQTTTQYTLRETRWYDYSPLSSRPGPVDKVTASAVAGTSASGRGPDQIAITSTYKTASRKHWGRTYWPTLNAVVYTANYGRFSTTVCDTLANATRTLFQTTGSSGLVCPVVVSIGHKAVMGIRELQVDDVPDVIRRRRDKMATYRKQYTN